ncbi:MAG: UDP-N-acetylmuramate--L-alanine ligase [Ectothiorhodospiraceae bacterium]|nr:UDP-N-acetylmuramate--L-alanine ligase [Chromatiales bacterium]MCP5153926.1 UDP-N-acetylmuramate--L-alanine ligase [Ectothiorhodospiraceae bacterium]
MRRVRRVHLVGIGGAGVGGIAEVLHTLGFAVSGSDLRDSNMTRRLRALGVTVWVGHAAEHVDGCDVLVVSSAVAEDNPELEAARARHIPVVPRAQMLAELMRFRYGIAVAGTHGKTTTTSLVASVLSEGGLDPTYVIGGRLNRGGTNARLGAGSYLVAEADESDASFLFLQPMMAVVTNVDADHMSTYGGEFTRLRAAFLEFLHHLPFYGLAVLCHDDATIRDLLPEVAKPVLTYGFDRRADLRATHVRQSGLRTRFRVARPGEPRWLDVQLNLPGRHNVQNALAAIGIAMELEVPEEAILSALAGFEGIGRRLQLHGDIDLGGARITLVDDYAHHPRELAATLQAARAAWPDRRLLVVFQPHRYSRTRDLFEDFAQVLAEVEALVVLEVYPAGESPIAGADARALCRAVRARGRVDPVFCPRVDNLADLLPDIVADGDVVLTLGAGDIGTAAPELAARWRGASEGGRT